MNYDEMSDFEINKAVALAEGLAIQTMVKPYTNVDGFTYESKIQCIEWQEGTSIKYCYRDYCNSWADAGPIIEEHKICLDYDGRWETYTESVLHITTGQPVLRAAMITFLKLQAWNAKQAKS